MKNYRNSTIKRLLGLIISVILLVGMIPAGAFAAGTGSFILVAEGGGELVIAPEYVTYEEGESIGAALVQSGHVFTGIEHGWITEIDGVAGNYSRSDEDGGYDLNKAAAEIGFFRFCEDESSQLSEGLQQLMTSMAEYKNKPADVRSAAKEAYDTACEQFVGLDSDSAFALAETLDAAVSDYENTQNGAKQTVTFSDGTNVYKAADITVRNTHGKVWTDDGDGVLELPAGEYDFCISRDGLMASGTIAVTGAMTVKAALPEKTWLIQDDFRLSGSYGAENSEYGKFTDDEFQPGEWTGRSVNVPVLDTFTGKVYVYAKYDESILTEIPKLTAIYTSAKTGEEVVEKLPFESLMSGTSNVLRRGAEGNTVTYRISSEGSDGYTYSQDYTVNFNRIPTLQGISISDQKGVGQAATTPFAADENEYVYKVLDTVTEVTVKPVPMDAGYSVSINGEDAVNGVTIPVAGETEVPVVVTAGGFSNTYNLIIRPGEGKKLSFITERSSVTMEVVNENGEVLPYEKFREGTNGNRYQYTLVPGETYSYVATSNTYFHIADEFTMEDAADSTIEVDVPEDNWMKELAFGKGGKQSSNKNNLSMGTFAADNHHYTIKLEDTEHLPYVWATAKSGVTISAVYEQKDSAEKYHGKTASVAVTSGSKSGTQLPKMLIDENPVENTLKVQLTKEVDGVTCYQDYVVDFQRILSLKDLTAEYGGMTMSLVQEDKTVGFAPGVTEYSVTVSMAAESLNLSMESYDENYCYGEDNIGYRIKVDGKDVTEASAAVIPLNGTLETQTVTVTVENDKAPEGTTDYIIHIMKSPPVDVDFDITPDNALLAMYETMSGERVWPGEDGGFQLCEGYSYNYNLTAYGYVSKTGTLKVTRDDDKALVVTDGEDVYTVTENGDGGGALDIAWTLAAAEKNETIRTDMESEWSSFRGNEDNNGVTDAAIPTAAENSTLYWANKLGNGYSADAVGSPILVDGDLITYAGDKIFRVDTVSGAIKAIGTMDHKSAHATTPPSYAEGMVFVALTDGTVQAFNAETLESLWIYKDPLGGQPVCPLTIQDGYLYTGFWNNEASDANFVCISITDEDPSKPDENKSVSWYHTAKGGFYWAGAYVSEDYVLMGTDDGTSSCDAPSSRMLMFDPHTGRLMDSWDGLNGDIRSSVVYDSETDAYYFTAKGGTFYSMKVVKEVDGWSFTDKWSIALENGKGGIPMSTCSPSVYNGRAYVGVSGAGQFAAYSGHNITVIDLASRSVAYRVATQGYPQTSGLLTTAYEEESGYVYVYFFDNMTPGKLRVLRDKPGQTAADYLTTENGKTTAYALFTPTGDQAQYAICSPIVDEYGTIFFKNDSAYMMAFGSKIEKIEVTKAPDKMIYSNGEAFDPAGMTVTATYANGKTRDVTDYVSFDTEWITAGKTTVTITFPYVMYHNTEAGTGMVSGTSSATPVTTLDVVIGSALGDVDGNGEVDTLDAGLIISYYYGDVEFTTEELFAADVNGDGEIDTDDAGLIVSYYHGSVTQFR